MCVEISVSQKKFFCFFFRTFLQKNLFCGLLLKLLLLQKNSKKTDTCNPQLNKSAQEKKNGK